MNNQKTAMYKPYHSIPNFSIQEYPSLTFSTFILQPHQADRPKVAPRTSSAPHLGSVDS